MAKIWRKPILKQNVMEYFGGNNRCNRVVDFEICQRSWGDKQWTERLGIASHLAADYFHMTSPIMKGAEKFVLPGRTMLTLHVFDLSVDGVAEITHSGPASPSDTALLLIREIKASWLMPLMLTGFAVLPLRTESSVPTSAGWSFEHTVTMLWGCRTM